MARSRDIEYRIGFSGDVSQLEAAVKKATESLNKLGTNPDKLRLGLDGAARSALELSNHLSTAFNQNTGKLDLIKFRQQLDSSGKSLQAYATDLRRLGPEGEQAFLEMASAIGKAELPLRRTNSIVKQFGVTLWNTARWRITTSAINTFVSGLQQAYGYSKSLDASLNNIRIVTQKSADEMGAFAKQANAAAKTLSTTTTTYTDAALIYYQQGLSDDAVAKRTETTIKMANVTGQAAEEISSQMTAIWNNFEDGSRSLESFGDSITALGATTAASSQEIAEGLQKFAPIANTVGLSFDYASAALTTIVQNTRESATAAGTSLKTLFSRLEGLKLGKTLDDGTDLNKYSNALLAVGVNIKTTSGELKDMDQILDELGAKWQTLARDQQMALAETVGGVRQYAQLVALMDNWTDFQKNLATSQGAEGNLERQAAIYAESWEAARNRVKAASEDIYDSLINPEQFIKLDNLLTPFLTGVASAIDTLGGLMGILPLVSSLMFQAFGDQIAQSMRNMITNIGLMTGAEQQRARVLQELVSTTAQQLNLTNIGDEVAARKIEILRQEVGLQGEINSIIDSMPAKQKAQVEVESQMLDILKQQALEAAEIAAQKRQAVEEAESNLISSAIPTARSPFGATSVNQTPWLDQAFMDSINQLTSQDYDKGVTALVNKFEELGNTKQSIKQLEVAFDDVNNVTKENIISAQNLLKTLGRLPTAANDVNALKTALATTSKELNDSQARVGAGLARVGAQTKDVTALGAAVSESAKSMADSSAALDQYSDGVERLTNTVHRSKFEFMDFADYLVEFGATASRIAIQLRAMQSLFDTFSKDNKADKSTKLIQRLTSFSMLLPSISRNAKDLMSAFKNTNKVISLTNDLNNANKSLDAARNALSAATAGTAAYTKAQKDFAQATIAAKNAQDALNAGIRKASWAAGGITAAITIIIAAVALYLNYQKKLAEERKKANEEAVESVKNLKEEADSINEVVSAYKQLLNTADDTVESKDAIAEKALEVAKALNIEGAALANLTGDYTAFNEAVAKAEKDKAQQNFLKTANNMAVIDKNLQSSNPIFNNQSLVTTNGIDNAGIRTYAQYLEQNAKGLVYTRDQGLDTHYEAYAPTIEKRLQLIQVLQDFVDEYDFKTNQDIQGIEQQVEKAKKQIDELKTSVAEYIEAYDNFLVAKATAESYSVEPQYYKDFKTWRENTETGFEAVGKSASEAENLISQVITNLGYEEWERIYDITQATIQQLRDFPEIIEYIESYLQNHEVTPDDAEVISQMTWGLVDRVNGQIDDNSFNAEKERTEERIQLQQEGAQAAIDYANAEKFLQQVQSKSGLKAKDLEGFVTFFGEQKNARQEMIKFLESSDEEQTRWANDIIYRYYQAEQDKAKEQRQALEAEIELIKTRLEELADFDTPEKQADYLEAVNGRSKAENLITTYFAQRGDYKKQGEKQLQQFQQETADALTQALAGKGFGFTSIWSMLLGDEETALKQIQTAWKPFIDETVGDVVGLHKQLNTAQGELETIANTIELMPSFKLGQEIQIAENVKSLGELNKQYRLRNIHIDAYNKGIVKLAKSVPGAAASLKKYNDAVADGNEPKRIEALEELRKLVEDDAWGRAFATVKKINDELKASGATLEDPGKLGINQHADKLKEVAKALNEAFETEWFDPAKVQDNADTINQILNGEEDALTSIYNMIDFATAVTTEDVKNALADIGLTADQITSLVSELDGLQFGIDGYANVDPIIQNLKSVGYTASQIAAILSALGNSIVGFELEGWDQYNAILAEYEEMQFTDPAGYQKLKMQALSYLKIKGNTTTPPSGYIADTKGGGGSNYQKDPSKDLEDASNRYHEINRELERQERILSEIDKTISRTYGTEKLDAYGKQQDELTKKLELQRKKYDEASKHLVDDREKLFSLDSQGLPVGFADALNRYGNLTFQSLTDYGEFAGYDDAGNAIYSYQKLREEIVEKYNAKATEIADKMAATKDTDELKKEKEELEKWFNDLEKWFSNYETSLDTYNTTVHEMAETKRQIEDNKLNVIEFKLQLATDVRDLRKQINDFTKAIAESLGDNLTHVLQTTAADELSAQDNIQLWLKQQETWADLQKLYKEATTETDKNAIIEQMKDLQGNIIATGEELLSWLDETENMYADALKDASDRFNSFTNRLAHQTEIISTIKELYALQGVTYKTQKGFEELQNASMKQYQGYLYEAQANKSWYEETGTRLAEAEAALAQVTEGDVNYDTLKKNRDELLAQHQEAQKAMLENAKQAMETAKQMALDTVDRVSYELEQKLTNNLGFDLLQDKFDHFIEENERYLDEVEEGLETAQWYSKLQVDIDKTRNKGYKDRLTALQKEIDLRRENNTLSKYDLEILEAKYQVLQAEMALEDARNNKTQLRLVRDSQGNWNYQYTANLDNIKDKEQELLKARENYYEITKERTKDLYSDLVKLGEEYAQKDAEIRKQVIEGVLTEEEGQRRLQELQEYYTKKANFLQTELNVAKDDMNKAALEAEVSAAALSESVLATSNDAIREIVTDLEQGGIDQYSIATSNFEELQGLLRDNVDDFQDISTDIRNVIADIIDGKTGEGSSLYDLSDAFDTELKDALRTMETTFVPQLTEHMRVAGGALSTFKEKVDAVANALGVDESNLTEMVNGAGEAMDSLYNALELAIPDMWTSLDAVRQQQAAYRDWATYIWECVNAMKALTKDDITPQIEENAGNPLAPNYDASADYSRLMGKAAKAGNWSQFEKYAQLRDAKIAGTGKTPDVSTEELKSVLEDAYKNGRDEWIPALEAVLNDPHTYYKDVITALKKSFPELDIPEVGTTETKVQTPAPTETPTSSAAENVTPTKVETTPSVGYTAEEVKQAWDAMNSGKRFLGSFADEPYYNVLKDLMEMTYAPKYGGQGMPWDEAWRIVREKYGFRTGGYTGDWPGDNGRLALLHQKEQVFNAEDTERLLAAAQLVRGVSDSLFASIGKQLDSNALVTMALLGSRFGGVGLPAATGGELEQHVTIEQVNFPNVSSAREIEEAFESLVNDAAQWARRRNK